MQKIMIPGPEGQLEALVTQPDAVPRAVVIICHPHPLYQGTMHNKVVTTIAKAFAEQEVVTVRFNYRGVGASAGGYGDMQGEILDLLAVKAWVQCRFPGLALYLAGFSFGAYITAAVANQSNDVVQLISVAPAVNHADFSALTQIDCPWLVIAAGQDEVVAYAEILVFTAQATVPLDLVTLPSSSHFFHGQLLQLRELLLQHVKII